LTAIHDTKILIGRIAGAVGIKGEIRLFHYSGERERIEGIEELYLLVGGKLEKRKILSMRYKGRIPILELSGVSDRNTAEALLNTEVYIEKEALNPLEEDSIYVEELTGMSVIDLSGNKIGTVAGILDNPAHDILKINRSESGFVEILLPMIDVFIRDIDRVSGTITVTPPEGLIGDSYDA
jgi:16S rRNA processing protein RimM